MAKKPQTVEQQIASQFGKNILVGAQHILDSERVIIPISPKLDMITTGGILEGSLTTLSGMPKLGKTITALNIAANAQSPEYGGEFCPEGREVYYYDVEGRLRKRDLEGIPHLNKDKFHIIQSTPGNILNGAEILQIAHTLISQKLGAVHIIDSLSALCTEAEMNSGMDEMQRADGPKLLAKFCRKISNIIPVNRCIIIGIIHLNANPSGYGQALQEKSGYAIRYQADTRLRGKSHKAWKLSVDSNPIGQEVDWICECSPLGPPGQTATSHIRYGYGIDKYQELITLCVDVGIVQKGGSWYTIDTPDGEEKFQGLENLNKTLRSKPDLYNQLSKSLYDMIGIK